jgi:hypothetical protein
LSANADGVAFGPNAKGKHYVSLFKHRGSGDRTKKSCWLPLVSPPDEYGIFCSSDANEWYDAKGNYWGVRNSAAEPLGTDGERLAKFPATSNESDPWHGYPTSLLATERGGPDDATIDRMAASDQISVVVKAKLMRRKI